MPIEVIDAETAWGGHGQADAAIFGWPRRSAPDRLFPVAEPATRLGLKIQPHDKIFCIGSCFATELSRALHRRQYDVLSIFNELPKSPRRNIDDDRMFTKYNVASICNELRWALDPAADYRDESVFIETGEGQWQDFQLKGPGYSDDPAPAQAFRVAFNDAFKRVKEADVVIITLGLSEVWFDKQTGLHLNQTVPRSLAQRFPGRFELHVLDYVETLTYLNQIHALLQAHLKPGYRLLITVSPVPLARTFRSQDVLVANTYSKSLLRAAVEGFVAGKANVGYFPSYEFVTLSHPEAVWSADDFRHVTGVFIDYIMAHVLKDMAPGAPESALQMIQLAKAKVLYQANFLERAERLLLPLKQGAPGVAKEATMLLSALKLGVKSKRSGWMTALEYFRTHRGSSWSEHLARWLKIRSRRQLRQYSGYIDHWRAPQLVGWALNTQRHEPIQVKVLVDGVAVKTLVAELPRVDVQTRYPDQLHCGFSIRLDLDTSSSHKIQVLYADTGRELNGSPVYT